MKTIVFPDIHNHVDRIESTIEYVKPDRVVFLGDYFDSFGDSVSDMERTCLWLRQSLNKPNRIHLLGNHDIAYLFEVGSEWKNFGWNIAKELTAKEFFTNDLVDKFQMSYKQNGWLLTHAGVDFDGLGIETVEEAEKSCEEALQALKSGESHVLLTMRGCMWVRWGRWKPKVVNQLFGHTAGTDIRAEEYNGIRNMCMDAPARYAIIETGKSLKFGHQK